MIRHFAAAALVSVSMAASIVSSTPAFADSADTYISNPVTDSSLQSFCDGQATAANNLAAQNQTARAKEVVAAANMRGCRIFTFESP
ncbi:MAG: hypothetical protein GX610_04275 [Rhodococcus sp.]|nr:hypothetical protein [Rhodococcus sp. (in: high G+C Gram-positive bacteria)]